MVLENFLRMMNQFTFIKFSFNKHRFHRELVSENLNFVPFKVFKQLMTSVSHNGNP